MWNDSKNISLVAIWEEDSFSTNFMDQYKMSCLTGQLWSHTEGNKPGKAWVKLKHATAMFQRTRRINMNTAAACTETARCGSVGG